MNLDWTQIFSTYPKAYNKCYSYFGNDPSLEEERRLYDFFDKEKIKITIQIWEGYESKWHYYINIPCKTNEHWNWEIIDEDIREIATDTRSEAEAKAFKRAFKIIEENIREKIIL